ncbi:hypothetical protein J1614_001020 [Plenodomus biglobosus]|nr:hypothetical protein J1614_001020 [Plenodomus biglobosus]
MFYLIFTTYHDRPYPCKVAFMARDLKSWGCRVDRYPDNSPYIAELRAREERGNPKQVRRIDLTEIWAREVIARKRECWLHMSMLQPTVTEDHLPEECRRHARASGIVQDFIWGLVAFGMYIAVCAPSARFTYAVSDRLPWTDLAQDKPNSKPTHPPVDPRPIPESPYALVSTYFRLLRKFRHTPNATLPQNSNPDFIVADEVVMEFRFHESLKLAYLAHAVMVATGKRRLGSVEQNTSTGSMKVTLFVEVSDCMLQQYDVETRDPVPAYERGEYPPAYVSA